MKRLFLFSAFSLLAFCLLSPPALLAAPGDLTVLHSFGGPDGQHGLSQKVVVDGARIYGMTFYGGSWNIGVVYSMNLDGSGYQVLHEFAGGAGDGGEPRGSLTLSDSTLYGVTYVGGSTGQGTIFSIATDGTGFAVLHEFAGGAGDGEYPNGSLTLSGSTLYGTTVQGGALDYGTIFSIATDGTGFAVLHSFAGGVSDGLAAWGTLPLSGSTLYGMTAYGGIFNKGTIFSIGTDGTGFALLHSFAGGVADGREPISSLTLSGSSLYGMTAWGGASNLGTLFSIATDGSGYAVLHNFAGGAGDGKQPGGSLTLSGSTLFGMTIYGGASDFGTLFSIATDGAGYAVLHNFAGGAGDGKTPNQESPTISGSLLYGQTVYGGSDDLGVVFSYDLSEASPPVTWDFEDGTTGDWGISSHPNLTVLRNVADQDRGGNVIELRANTMDTWFSMAGPGGADLGETNTVLEWSMKSVGFFYVYVDVDTTGGPMTLYYTPAETTPVLQGSYARLGLAYATIYGQWSTYVRDLDADLAAAGSLETITAVNGFHFRGTNLRVDDISLLAAIPADFDSDADGLMDVEERDTYGTGLYDADSDDDGLNDGPEVTAWGLLGQSWDDNADGTGALNLLDTDADDDGFDDGTEVAAGSDPGDASSIPPVSYDWNDGGISGWSVVSGLGLVRNVARDEGRAIELRGTTSTTFSLKNADGTLWHDNVHDTLNWT